MVELPLIPVLYSDRVVRASGRSNRTSYHVSRPRKLSPEQEVTIRREAQNRTLRDLAAEFGVSHETVRAVCRR